MNRVVAYIAKVATAGKDTSIPPERITSISHNANICMISMALAVLNSVAPPQNEGLITPITLQRRTIRIKITVSFLSNSFFSFSFI